jgi:hypothetical protein
MTSTTVAKATTTPKAPAKRASAKQVAPLTYNPGKVARPASTGSERKREAEDAVPPSMEGGNAALINAFLEPRFLWFFAAEFQGEHIVWGATHDRVIGDPETVSEAVQRATHTGRGTSAPLAKRDLMTQVVAADRSLQTRFKKPTVARKTATSKGAAPQVKSGEGTKATKPPTKAEAKRAEKAQAAAEANPVDKAAVDAEIAATIAELKGETPVVETPKPKPPRKRAVKATSPEAPASDESTPAEAPASV